MGFLKLGIIKKARLYKGFVLSGTHSTNGSRQMQLPWISSSCRDLGGCCGSEQGLSQVQGKPFRCCTLRAFSSSLLLNDLMHFTTQGYPKCQAPSAPFISKQFLTNVKASNSGTAQSPEHSRFVLIPVA